MSKYDELKKLAEAATPGPWSYDGSYICPARVEDETTYVETWRAVADSHQTENVRFIAAANPAAILKLIAENERLRNAIAGLLEWVAPIAGDNQDDEASQRELDSVRAAEAAMQEAAK